MHARRRCPDSESALRASRLVDDLLILDVPRQLFMKRGNLILVLFTFQVQLLLYLLQLLSLSLERWHINASKLLVILHQLLGQLLHGFSRHGLQLTLLGTYLWQSLSWTSWSFGLRSP